jgi:hypothetical protein
VNDLARIDTEDEAYFRDLVGQAKGMSNPPPKLAGALRQALENMPELYKGVFDLARSIQEEMVQNIAPFGLPQDALVGQLETMRRGMDYYQAPELVKGLVENVLSAWLRLQWVEAHQAKNEKSAIEDMIFWERRHSAAMRRYLQSCEVLARVRKLTSPVMQVNIANQQVNFAGDMMK